MDDFFSWLSETVTDALGYVFDLLDICPFPDIIDSLASNASSGFAWLNWIFPVGGCLGILSAWLTCLALYYAISVLLRWLRAIR